MHRPKHVRMVTDRKAAGWPSCHPGPVGSCQCFPQGLDSTASWWTGERKSGTNLAHGQTRARLPWTSLCCRRCHLRECKAKYTRTQEITRMKQLFNWTQVSTVSPIICQPQLTLRLLVFLTVLCNFSTHNVFSSLTVFEYGRRQHKSHTLDWESQFQSLDMGETVEWHHYQDTL